jgi:hypothetical protein
MNALGAVRMAIYAAIVDCGRAPTPAELAPRLDLEIAEVANAFRHLADAHVIVVRQGTVEILWAPPFSVVPTPFRSTAGSRSWHAPCAWDAFGIPAALSQDAAIEARCAWSDELIACGVEGGRAYGGGVVHVLVPAAHFWDDIGYT